MNSWDYEEKRGSAGGILLLTGVALGTAAAWLLSRPGRQTREEIVSRVGGWTTHAANALAQAREELIAAVEQDKPSPAGPIKEKPRE